MRDLFKNHVMKCSMNHGWHIFFLNVEVRLNSIHLFLVGGE